ncbi:MAG TPA: AAA family ATPase, partial [Methanocorpusculum sp.]|nr:AAA family ATPase [Methanocorpusculum sp.]
KNTLVEYYRKLRSVAYESTDKPVPVTARQLEALVRLAEASARVRLADKVSMDDAARVIKIVDACLRQVAYDAKTGNFDIDKIASTTTKAGRTLRRDLKEAIKELADSTKTAKLDDVYRHLTGMNYTKEEIERAIDSMRAGGEVILPKNGIIKLV